MNTQDQHKTPNPGTEPEHEADRGYETSDVNIPRILTIVTVIALFLVAVFLLLNSYFLVSKEKITYEQVLKPDSKKLQELRDREAEALHTYGVIDTAQNKYRIPIGRAKQLVAEEEFRQRVQNSREQQGR